MEVQIRIQLRRIEFVQRFGMFGRYVTIADELANDCPVLAFPGPDLSGHLKSGQWWSALSWLLQVRLLVKSTIIVPIISAML